MGGIRGKRSRERKGGPVVKACGAGCGRRDGGGCERHCGGGYGWRGGNSSSLSHSHSLLGDTRENEEPLIIPVLISLMFSFYITPNPLYSFDLWVMPGVAEYFYFLNIFLSWVKQ